MGGASVPDVSGDESEVGVDSLLRELGGVDRPCGWWRLIQGRYFDDLLPCRHRIECFVGESLKGQVALRAPHSLLTAFWTKERAPKELPPPDDFDDMDDVDEQAQGSTED